MINPCFFLRVHFPRMKKINTRRVLIPRNIISYWIAKLSTYIGWIIQFIHKIRSILVILDPMMLPRAISGFFLRIATILVISSGRVVPIATIVNQIVLSSIPTIFAISMAPSTTQFHPITNPTNPIATNTNDLRKDICSTSASSLALSFLIQGLR